MGVLYDFICPECGFSIQAPDTEYGHYGLFRGEVQLFLDKESGKVVEVTIPGVWVPDDEPFPIGKLRRLLRGRPAVSDDGSIVDGASITDRYTPWNAQTCGCPNCGAKLVSEGIMMMVD